MTPSQAIALQKELAAKIERTDRLPEIRHLAGVDVGFEDDGRTTRAAVAVLAADSLELVDQAIARRPTEFPYIPGLLSFREVPAMLEALERVTIRPDLLLVDGQGIAHPRRIGVACHLGLLADLPSLGVGKSRLTGRHGPVPEKRGEWTPLTDRGEVIGAVLRSRVGVAPLYISSGHRISLETSLYWVMHTLTRYRLPETTRHAHRLASHPPPNF